MTSCRSSMAHPRLFPAHGPEPLTAPGAAQACPTCLPSPSHQLTFDDDLRPNRPLQKGPRFAPCHFAIGDLTGKRPADTQSRIPAMNVLMSGLCSGRQGWRPLALLFFTQSAHQHNSPDLLGFARPVIPSSPLRPDTRLRAERFGAVTFRPSPFASLPMPVPASLSLICRIADVWPRLRPLAVAATVNPANQPTSEGDLRHGLPLKKAVRFAPNLSSIGDSTGNRPAHILAFLPNCVLVAAGCGHCSGLQALCCPSSIADAATRHSFAEFSGMVRPFVASSFGLSARLRAQRIGGFIQSDGRNLPPAPSGFLACPSPRRDESDLKTWLALPSHTTDATERKTRRTTALSPPAFNPMNAFRHPASPDLINLLRRSHVIQDSDFRWKSRGRKKLSFSLVPSGVRRPSERLAAAHQTPSVEINT